MTKECMCFRNYICLSCEGGVKPKRTVSTQRKIAVCGTRAGYQRHLKQGEPTCLECKKAQTASVKKFNKEKALK